MKSKVTCKECGHESVRFDPFNYLSLPLPMESYVCLQVIGNIFVLLHFFLVLIMILNVLKINILKVFNSILLSKGVPQLQILG